MNQHGPYKDVYDGLLADPDYSRRRALRALKKGLNDPNAWLCDWHSPNKRWLMTQLGFPEEMPGNAVRDYWHRLCDAEIVQDEWHLKAAFILTAFGIDPFPWLQETLASGKYLTEIVDSVRKMLKRNKSLVTLMSDGPLLSLARYGYERGLFRISPFFWDLVMRDVESVKSKVRSTMRRALDLPECWSRFGRLRHRPFLQELGVPKESKKQVSVKVWKRIVALGAFPPICHNKAAFVLYALGFDPLAWIEEKYPEATAWKLAGVLNEILAQRGHALHISEDPVYVLADSSRRQRVAESMPWTSVIESLGVNGGPVQQEVAGIMKLALDEPRFWSVNGKLNRQVFLEAVVGRPLTSWLSTKLWEELIRQKIVHPVCIYTAGFVLQALGFDPINWVEANYHPMEVGAMINLARKINVLLQESGYSFRMGEHTSGLSRFLHSMVRQNLL